MEEDTKCPACKEEGKQRRFENYICINDKCRVKEFVSY